MNSRYNFMESSDTLDEGLNDYYPDPLSLNYQKFSLSSGKYPEEVIMNMGNLTRIWKEARSKYGTAEWDDIVLTLNGVEHNNLLEIGDLLLFPELLDITNSFNKNNA